MLDFLIGTGSFGHETLGSRGYLGSHDCSRTQVSPAMGLYHRNRRFGIGLLTHERNMGMTTLSDEGIIQYRDSGNIVIEPFRIADVNTASYDVRLGPWYYREQQNNKSILNLYSPDTANKIWGAQQYAEAAADWMKHYPEIDWRGISKSDQVILIRPQENLLCHTIEFIGGRRGVTTAMKARSTTGRLLLNVCQCAGQGDIGYYNRWTMEVYNRSQFFSLILVVNRRVAQIVFDVTTESKRSYGDINEGNYQDGADVRKLINTWNARLMLPRAHTDRDIPEDAER
jgi:dCTP deaminase